MKDTQTKIVLITRRTRLDELLYRHNTLQQARFYVESLGADFDEYVEEDKVYNKSLTTCSAHLSPLGRVQVIDREFLPNFLFGPDDVIVVIGQDGTLANTLKYTPDRPVIAVNPDPGRFDGTLLPFSPSDLPLIVSDVMQANFDFSEITMAKVELSNGQQLLAVNDLFIGPANHTSARYELSIDGNSEFQSSSGIIVSTGLGSTGWFKSILTGAIGVTQALDSQPHAQALNQAERYINQGFDWDSDFLYYSVREPFSSQTSSTNLVFGMINNSNPLTIVSAMPQNGVIFSDGQVEDVIQFSSGISASISTSEHKGLLVI